MSSRWMRDVGEAASRRFVSEAQKGELATGTKRRDAASPVEGRRLDEAGGTPLPRWRAPSGRSGGDAASPGGSLVLRCDQERNEK